MENIKTYSGKGKITVGRGLINIARDFDGTDDKIVYTLATGQTGFTIVTVAWWEYLDSNAAYRRAFHLDAGTQDWRLEFDDSWGYAWIVPWTTAPSGRAAWGITKPTTGSWHHICVTYDGSLTTNAPIMYVNGASQSVTLRSAPGGSLVTPSTSLWISSENGTGQYFDGRLAEYAIWSGRALSLGEVEGLADGFSPLFYPNNLEFYTPLLGRRTDEADLMYGTAGTLTGTSAIAHPRIIYPSPGMIRRFTTAVAPSAVTAATRRMFVGVGI